MHAQTRLEILIGTEAIEKLRLAKIAIFGVGGVGSICVEALARSGVGHMTLIDGDVVDITNINRQLPALHSTLGHNKANVMATRLRDINQHAEIISYNYMWHNDSDFIKLDEYDYIIDAIDSVPDKVNLIAQCKLHDIPIISSMGAGGRLRGDKFEISDINKTYNDPLAKKMRFELKKRNIRNLKVVFSTELPIKAEKGPVGSAMFALSCAGLMIAGEVVKDLIGDINE